MSEYVESGLEELLPVFQRLVSTKLFSRSEVEKVVGECRSREYALQKRVKRSSDFGAYAKYLIDLSRLIHIRRKKLDNWDKKEEVNKSLCGKIENVLGRACERFRDDVGLWTQRIEFAKNRTAGVSVSKLYLRLLQVQPEREEIWVAASDWEFGENDSIDNSRALLQKGLRQSPKSEFLWTALLRLELRIADKLTRRRLHLAKEQEEGGEPEVKKERVEEGGDLLAVVRVVFANAAESVDGERGRVLVRLLDLLASFPFAVELARELEREWEQRLPDSPELGIRKVLGRVAEWEAGLDTVVLDRGDHEERTARDRLLLGLELFEEERDAKPGLGAELSSAALAFALPILRAPGRLTRHADARVEEATGKLLELAQSMEDPTEAIARIAAALQPTAAIPVLQHALKEHPNSAHLWHSFLATRAEDPATQPSQLKKDFNKAVKIVAPSEALPLWELAVKSMSRLHPGPVTLIIQRWWETEGDWVGESVEGVLQSSQSGSAGPAVRQGLKPAYVAWAAANLSPKALHQLFLRLARDKPASVGFYTAYLDTLALQPKLNKDAMREAMNLAVSEHGSDRPDLWIRFIRMWVLVVKRERGDYWRWESEWGEGSRVGAVYTRALTNLRPEHQETFSTAWILSKAQ